MLSEPSTSQPPGAHGPSWLWLQAQQQLWQDARANVPSAAAAGPGCLDRIDALIAAAQTAQAAALRPPTTAHPRPAAAQPAFAPPAGVPVAGAPSRRSPRPLRERSAPGAATAAGAHSRTGSDDASAHAPPVFAPPPRVIAQPPHCLPSGVQLPGASRVASAAHDARRNRANGPFTPDPTGEASAAAVVDTVRRGAAPPAFSDGPDPRLAAWGVARGDWCGPGPRSDGCDRDASAFSSYAARLQLQPPPGALHGVCSAKRIVDSITARSARPREDAGSAGAPIGRSPAAAWAPAPPHSAREPSPGDAERDPFRGRTESRSAHGAPEPDRSADVTQRFVRGVAIDRDGQVALDASALAAAAAATPRFGAPVHFGSAEAPGDRFAPSSPTAAPGQPPPMRRQPGAHDATFAQPHAPSPRREDPPACAVVTTGQPSARSAARKRTHAALELSPASFDGERPAATAAELLQHLHRRAGLQTVLPLAAEIRMRTGRVDTLAGRRNDSTWSAAATVPTDDPSIYVAQPVDDGSAAVTALRREAAYDRATPRPEMPPSGREDPSASSCGVAGHDLPSRQHPAPPRLGGADGESAYAQPARSAARNQPHVTSRQDFKRADAAPAPLRGAALDPSAHASRMCTLPDTHGRPTDARGAPCSEPRCSRLEDDAPPSDSPEARSARAAMRAEVRDRVRRRSRPVRHRDDYAVEWGGAQEGDGDDAGPARLSKPQDATSERGVTLPAGMTRGKRVPGGDPMANPKFRELVTSLRRSGADFGECAGRVLRLKPYLSSDARPAQLDAVLDALLHNWRVEVLYIQNFERGMFDEQLEKLTLVLKQKRIWALNVGENFMISLKAWKKFCAALPETMVSFMYVSEHHLVGTDLKLRMRDAIRNNRRAGGARDPFVCTHVNNMWFNPKVVGGRHCGASTDAMTGRGASDACDVRQLVARRKAEIAASDAALASLRAQGLVPPLAPRPPGVAPPPVKTVVRHVPVPAAVARVMGVDLPDGVWHVALRFPETAAAAACAVPDPCGPLLPVQPDQVYAMQRDALGLNPSPAELPRLERVHANAGGRVALFQRASYLFVPLYAEFDADAAATRETESGAGGGWTAAQDGDAWRKDDSPPADADDVAQGPPRRRSATGRPPRATGDPTTVLKGAPRRAGAPPTAEAPLPRRTGGARAHHDAATAAQRSAFLQQCEALEVERQAPGVAAMLSGGGEARGRAPSSDAGAAAAQPPRRRSAPAARDGADARPPLGRQRNSGGHAHGRKRRPAASPSGDEMDWGDERHARRFPAKRHCAPPTRYADAIKLDEDGDEGSAAEAAADEAVGVAAQPREARQRVASKRFQEAGPELRRQPAAQALACSLGVSVAS